ncbi:phage tail tape measure protein [Methylorubrum podarium]|uniref:Phage tail tape measure protein n=1 Tax=Methylorubrum podarium TaxID=200476 RepID=A0ABV1QUB4_9HYPH
MSTDNMNVAIGLTVDTSGEELIERLNRKVKQLQASLRAINADMAKTAKAASFPGSNPTQKGNANQGKADSDAKRSAAGLYGFKSRLEAQRQREAERNEQFLHRLRQNSFRQAERDQAKAIRDRVAGESRVASEQRKAAQDAARSARDEVRSIREKVSFTARMSALRQREEAETARAQDRATRDAIRLDRYRLGLRDREERRLAREAAREDRERSQSYRSGLSNARSAASHGRDSYNTLTRTGAAAAVVGTAATASLARRALTAESDIDSAEINSRIYGGLSKDAARQLRDQWAAPLAEDLGVGTAKLLSSYTDALKVGIDPTGAKEFSALATQTSEAWGVPFEGVVDIIGTVNSILTSTGDAFDFGKLKGVANSIQYLAAKQSTTPEKLISFLQRGAGGAQVLGMSQEAGLAFGSASTSLGNQAAESGRLFDFIAGRLVSMPDLVKKQGLEGTRARELVRNLGYGSAGELDRQRRASPDDFLPDFVRRFNGVKDTKKQEQLLKFFAGQEWFGEFGRIVKGFDKYKEAADLAKESKKLDAIGEVWNLHKLKLAFVFKQISTGFLNIMGEIGKVLSPMARQVGDYFLEWSRKLQGGGLRLRVQAAIEGFIDGFGFKDLPHMLKGIFGEPGQGDAGAVETWRSTAKAFAEGIRDTLNALKGMFSFFTGSTGTPEEIARWTGRLITFAAACLVAAPAIAVLGGLASGITALSVAALSAFKLLKAAGLIGGASAVAGGAGAGSSAGAAAGAATGAGLLSRLMRIFGGASINMSPSFTKDEADDLTRRLGKFAEERNKAREDSARGWIDPPAKSTNDNLRKPADDLKKAIEDNTLIQKQSYEANDNFTGLIRKASFTSGEAGRVTRTSIQGGAADLRSAVLSGSSSSVGSGGGGPLSSSAPGSALGNVGIGGRGIIGGGRTSPGFGPGDGPSGPIAPFKGSATFDGMAPRIMADLRKDFGLTKEQAAGILGNLGHESAGFTAYQEKNPLGGGRGGAGWAQWTGPRRRQFEAWAAQRGLDPRSYEANYGFLRHELNTSEKGAMGAVRRQSTAQGAMVAFENGFERAGVKNWSSRQKWTNRALGLADVSPGLSGPEQSGQEADVSRRVSALRTVSQECVALAKAAVGVSGSVTGWRKGIGADQGTLKPGTPIATFLNRDGSTSHRYDGGGTGVRGNNTTHAGVFNKYLKDKIGRIVGMEVVEQFKGSNGPRLKNYMFGQGSGARNGSNYNAILGSDGQLLGGSRNPMQNARDNAESLVGPMRGSAGGGDPGFTSTGWKPLGGGAPLGEAAPISPSRSGQGGGSSSTSVQAPITINGAGQNADQIASAVQRKLQESMNRRTHDLDPSSMSNIG